MTAHLTALAPVDAPPLSSTAGAGQASSQLLESSARRTVAWVTRHGYRAYEPADGNASLLFPLTFGRVLPMRLLQQFALRAPFNVRPLVGVRPHQSAIGRAYIGWGCLRLATTVGERWLLDEARACFEWLIVNRAAKHSDFCWGDPYHYATRSGRRPRGEPLLIWSALAGQAFLDAYESLGDPRYLDVAASVGRWIMALPREQTETGVCLSYVAYRQSSIHNSNAMGAAFLARLAAVTHADEMMALARRAMMYTCARQRPDGSWFYAEEPKFHWIDNFHTGYNLAALKTYRAASHDASFDAHRNQGFRYFRSTFFEADGTPKYFHDATYPVDIQCAAQSIETLALFADDEPGSLRDALKVADWTIRHMQAPDGHFCYRHLGWRRVSTPMLHWGQGTMIKALAVALEKVSLHV